MGQTAAQTTKTITITLFAIIDPGVCGHGVPSRQSSGRLPKAEKQQPLLREISLN
ncbi:MAG: hypothetical protein R2860_07735 [Desulfobacterales bacterium]